MNEEIKTLTLTVHKNRKKIYNDIKNLSLKKDEFDSITILHCEHSSKDVADFLNRHKGIKYYCDLSHENTELNHIQVGTSKVLILEKLLEFKRYNVDLAFSTDMVKEDLEYLEDDKKRALENGNWTEKDESRYIDYKNNFKGMWEFTGNDIGWMNDCFLYNEFEMPFNYTKSQAYSFLMNHLFNDIESEGYYNLDDDISYGCGTISDYIEKITDKFYWRF